MIPVYIWCPKCKKNLVTKMPDGQCWEFEDGEHKCEDCLVVLQIDHIHNELIWLDEYSHPEWN